MGPWSRVWSQTGVQAGWSTASGECRPCPGGQSVTPCPHPKAVLEAPAMGQPWVPTAPRPWLPDLPAPIVPVVDAGGAEGAWRHR